MNIEKEFNYNSNTNNFKKMKPQKSSCGFGKTIILPFISGLLGASVVMGACFGFPTLKSNLLNANQNKSTGIVSTNNNNTYTSTLIDLSDYSNTAVAVAQKVLPSVVGITVKYSVNSIWGQTEAEASGSGIIISEDGYIVTNNHVISTEKSSYYQITEATKITVNLYNDKESYEAKVVGSDAYSDLAVLKIEKENLPAATIGNSDEILVGEFVMAVGNPLGMDSSVTCGIVSALNRELTDDDGKTYVTIQTDAAINSGNSGGALVNSKGEVVGINTLKLSGSGIEGMGFAIPINSTTKIINQLTEYGEVIRPYIGISGYAVSESINEMVREQYQLPEGVYVKSVEKNSPAEEAGIQKGDIITKIAGTEIKNVTELNKVKNTFEVNDTVELEILRNNETITLKLVLKATPETKTEDSKQEKQQTYIPDSSSIFDLFR